jgi:nicotinamidase-related amidase
MKDESNTGASKQPILNVETALLLIDIQNDYFPGGKMELHRSVEAGMMAGKALDQFRTVGLPIVHVQHVATRPGMPFFLPDTKGVQIHESVKPLPGETVFQKHSFNAFRETPLLDHLNANGIRTLVICGMMTHMCVDATVRASFDHGFQCILLSDACATRGLSHQGVDVPTEFVQAAFLAALAGLYAKVVPTAALLP